MASVALADDVRAKFLRASTTDLSNPHDIKLSPDGKFLLVSDVGNNRVVVLDAGTLKKVATFGEGDQAGTHDIDFPTEDFPDGDPSERRAFIADTHNNRILIYDLGKSRANGKPKIIGTLTDRIRGPEGVLVHPNGRVYVGAAWSNNLVVFENGKVVNELKGLSSPHDVERTPDGNIWLSDSGNDRMLLLSPELKILKEWKGAPFNFNGVRYQDVMPDGTVIAADKNNHQVKIISPDGKPVLTLGDGRPGKGPGKFKTPEGVEIAGTKLYLSDSGNDRVVLYELSGLRTTN